MCWFFFWEDFVQVYGDEVMGEGEADALSYLLLVLETGGSDGAALRLLLSGSCAYECSTMICRMASSNNTHEGSSSIRDSWG